MLGFIAEADIDDAKREYAEALRAYMLLNPFDQNAPIKAAQKVWPEEEGKLPIALWAVYSEKWHDDEFVNAHIAELNEREAEAIAKKKAETLAKTKTPEFKEMLRNEIREEMRDIMKNRMYEPKDRITAADRITKLDNLDEKPVKDEMPANQIINVLQVPLRDMPEAEFEAAMEKQQASLQERLKTFDIELSQSDVKRIN